MARKINKKTRNTISGILVGIASIFAVINFADIPATEIRFFIVATILFFVGIVLLALLAVSLFKLLGLAKKRIASDDEEIERGNEWNEPGPDQDASNDDKV